jgi:hypothetical protein
VNQTSPAANGTTASIARITPSCAEHGTPSASSSIASRRSLRVGRMRVVSVAIVSQPRPSTIGSTALPFRPIRRNTRSVITASRGR